MIVKKADNLFDWLDQERNLDNTVSAVDYRKELTSWQKSEFRKSPEWKYFVKHMLNLRNHQCEICHTSEQLVVHHKDPLRYKDLSNVNNFAVLCCRCHLKIEANCRSQELMDAHPEYRKWYTFYPYSFDTMKWQSGYRTIKRWKRENIADINRPENVKSKKQIAEALHFMKQHPEFFM